MYEPTENMKLYLTTFYHKQK